MSLVLESLELEVVDGIAEIRLGDEAGSSRMNGSTVSDLLDVTARIAGDPVVRAVLLRPRGKDFSAGGDIAMFESMLEKGLAQGLDALIADYHLALARLAQLEVPVVAAVRGAAVGAGLGLACVADVVVAAEDVTLAAGGVALGLAADGGISWLLPRLVGLRRAQELLLLNRRLTGADALEWGIATEVLPSQEVDERAFALARWLAAGPTVAYGRLRALLLSTYETTLPGQLDREHDAMTSVASTEDVAGAVQSYLRHERPVFRGC